jgi:hypothetical protein
VKNDLKKMLSTKVTTIARMTSKTTVVGSTGASQN